MLDFVASTDVLIPVQFRLDGEPFIPDVASVTYTLRDKAGVPVSGCIDVSVTTTNVTTSINVTIAAAKNALAVDSRFEKRTLVVSGTRNSGSPFKVQIPYLIHPWLNHTTTPSDVRTFIGVGNDELPDSSINLLAAYIALEAKLTETTLTAALAAGGNDELIANQALVAQAVLDVLPSLKQRLLLLKADGPLRAQRDKIDLSAIEDVAKQRLSGALATLGGTDVSATDSFIYIVDRDDPYTGV